MAVRYWLTRSVVSRPRSSVNLLWRRSRRALSETRSRVDSAVVMNIESSNGRCGSPSSLGKFTMTQK